ncbi:MAG: hypothetical protein IJ058_04585 [Lachnospiraceae bacterium]|nr:hypothetical protein [Lachnospiraceae bacterium]
MSELFENKNKQGQKQLYKPMDLNANTFKAVSFVKDPVENTKVIGREGLAMPIPKEAKEKSVMGSVRRFFGFKRISDRDLSGVKGNIGLNEEKEENETVLKTPITDLSAEERKGDSVRLDKEKWIETERWIDDIIASDEYINATEETKRLVTDLKSAVTSGKDIRKSEAITGILNNETNRQLKEDLKIPEWLEGEEAEAERRKIMDKYADASLRMKLFTRLEEQTSGSLTVPNGAQIIDRTDDSYFTGRFKLDQKLHAGDGHTYDHIEYNMENKNSDRTKNVLFLNNPSTGDIEQGGVGDCYLMSAVSAIVEKDPDIIKKCMKDEGKTVLVRFYSMHTGEPVYVRVKKTSVYARFSVTENGQKVTSVNQTIGAKRSVWINLLEKAFSAVREKIDADIDDAHSKPLFGSRPKGYAILERGSASSAYMMLTGKRMKKRILPSQNKKVFVGINTLFSHVHYGEKESFMKGKKEGDVKRNADDWNRYKAKQIFGIDVPEGDNALMEVFKKNRVLNAYQDYLAKYLKDNFESKSNKDSFSLTGSTTAAFRTMTDLNLFLDSVDLAKMPTIELRGVDQTKMKRHYIEYFRRSIAASGLLLNGVNTNGCYSEEEKQIWKELNYSLTDKDGNKRVVLADTSKHDLEQKKGSAQLGNSGETVMGGIAGTHAYSIQGTCIREVNVCGKPVKLRFVIVRNPWRDNRVRLYEPDTMKPYMDTSKKNEDGTERRAQGVFLMEFSDFCQTFKSYEYEDMAPEEQQKTEKESLKVEKLRDQYKPALDMTADERESESVKKRNVILDELFKMSDESLNSPEYLKFSDNTQIIVGKINMMSMKSITPETRSKLMSEIFPTLEKLRKDYESYEKIEDEELKKAAHDKLVADYGEPDLLIKYAAIMLPVTGGALEVPENARIMEGTDDNLFVSDEDLKNKLYREDGSVLNHEKVYFDEAKSDMTAHPLFATEPSTEDVAQGNIGDCYMISGLNAMLEQDPAYIKSCMKDEGDTVVVRFFKYKSGDPVYVRVKKTVAFSKYTGKKDGEDFSHECRKGARRALWVHMFEKAFVIARDSLEDPSRTKGATGFAKIRGGKARIFIRMITKKKFNLTKAYGSLYESRKYINFGTLAYHVHYDEKNEFMKGKNEDGSVRTAKDWNLYKAKQIFGLDLIPSQDTKLYDLFRTNKIFEKYNGFMLKHLLKYFKSEGNNGYYQATPAFVTTNDLEMFLDSIDIKKMPVLNLKSGIDEDVLRERYIAYFRRSALATGLLKNNVCTDGNYSDLENEAFKQIQDAVHQTSGTNKMVLASTGAATLAWKSGEETGESGESLISGMASDHAYTIHGVKTEKRNIGGREVTLKFVHVLNPWNANRIRLYDNDTFKPYKADIQKNEDGTEYDAKGMCWMELRDFYETFYSFSIEEEENVEKEKTETKKTVKKKSVKKKTEKKQ